jgi:hypothetical protein
MSLRPADMTPEFTERTVYPSAKNVTTRCDLLAARLAVQPLSPASLPVQARNVFLLHTQISTRPRPRLCNGR